jgi:Host cell surface-exposed lipoprotein
MRRLTASAALGAALVALPGGSSASAAADDPPPPIDQIGAQYVTETGATSVACSQIPELIICYGLLDGVVVAATYADGAFTPYVSPTVPPAEAPANTGSDATSQTPTAAGEAAVPPEYTNALRKAEGYLDYMAFSLSGLVDQLEYEQFSTEAAQWAAENVDVDWNEQAALKAADYLDHTAFSEGGLRDQLEYEGFTPKQIDFAIAEMKAQGLL